MRNLALLFVVVGLLGGCASSRSRWSWGPASQFRVPPPGRYPQAVAVWLLSEEQQRIDFRYVGDIRRTTVLHRAVAVLTEAGLAAAEVRFPYEADSKVVTLQARTIAPDGAVRAVEPEQVIENTLIRKSLTGPEIKLRVVRFPSVKVGSVLEYVFVVRSPRQPSSHQRRLLEEYPVERYSFELSFPKQFNAIAPMSCRFRFYNREDAATHHEQGERSYITFHLTDLPARSDDPWQQPWQNREPWFGYRLNIGAIPPPEVLLSKLSAALDSAAHSWAQGALANVTLPVSRRSCPSTRCLVTGALTFLHQKVTLDDEAKLERLGDAWRTGRATANTKGFLLWAMLRQLGVNAHLAVFNREIAGIDEFVADDAILVVVEEDSAAGVKPLWIDPACESCRAGQLPADILGGSALLARRAAQPLLVKIVGQPVPPSRIARRHEVRLKVTGEVEDTITEERSGQAAVPLQGRVAQGRLKEWQAERERVVAQRLPTARLAVPSELPQCDRLQGRCTLREVLRVPSYVVDDGERLLVPLKLLTGVWDGRSLPPRREGGELYLRWGERIEDEAELSLPEGYEVEELPAMVHVEASPLSADFTTLVTEGKVMLRRVLRLEQGAFSEEGYPALLKALERYAKVRDEVLALRRTAVPATQAKPRP